MAYEERDERDLDYEQSLYEQDPAYEADTYFAERLDQAPEEDEALEEDEPVEEEAYSDEFGEQVVTEEPATTGTEKPEHSREADMRSEDMEDDLD